MTIWYDIIWYDIIFDYIWFDEYDDMISMIISVSLDMVFIIWHDTIWYDMMLTTLLQWLLSIPYDDDDDNDDDDDDYLSMKRVY